MKPAIRVDNLSKRFRIATGPRSQYRTLSETLVTSARGLARRVAGRQANGTGPAGMTDFWALKDVSFEVEPGEVVGIIGRNGAGKSTLLKVLSRIYTPTAGRAEIRGRLGSLLEVGTGFHPELSGRENVYLNGSILGMAKREIDRKFDEIVAFAGVDQFLDTPVKRYSSGMYVRLAFAVAAHLEPEILIVDEVLAVGDAGFQQQCFKKMEQIRRGGRTVIVVSHNLGAITTLCTRAINMEQGKVVSQGPADREVAWYLSRLTDVTRHPLADRTDREGDQQVKLTRVSFRAAGGSEVAQAVAGQEVSVVFHCEASDPAAAADYVAASCWTADGTKVFHVDTTERGRPMNQTGPARDYVCRFPRLPLPPGTYHWNVAVCGGGKVRDHVYAAATLDVLPGDFHHTGRTTDAGGGLVFVDHDWAG